MVREGADWRGSGWAGVWPAAPKVQGGSGRGGAAGLGALRWGFSVSVRGGKRCIP